MKRFLQRWRNRRAFWKVNSVYCYLFQSQFSDGDSCLDSLDILINAMAQLDAEYAEI